MLLNGKAANYFEIWAKRRVGFNYNRHSRRLTSLGKYFDSLPFAYQHSPIMEWLDSVGIVVNLDVAIKGGKTYFVSNVIINQGMDNNSINKFVFSSLLRDNRFEALSLSIEFAINTFNERY